MSLIVILPTYQKVFGSQIFAEETGKYFTLYYVVHTVRKLSTLIKDLILK